jgi:hypothetical protein
MEESRNLHDEDAPEHFSLDSTASAANFSRPVRIRNHPA